MSTRRSAIRHIAYSRADTSASIRVAHLHLAEAVSRTGKEEIVPSYGTRMASAARTGAVWYSLAGGAGGPLQQGIDVYADNRAEITRSTATIGLRTPRDRNLLNPEAAQVRDQICKCINNVRYFGSRERRKRGPLTISRSEKEAESSERGIAPAQGGRQRRLRLIERVLPALRLRAEEQFGRPHRLGLLRPGGWQRSLRDLMRRQAGAVAGGRGGIERSWRGRLVVQGEDGIDRSCMQRSL